LAAVEALRMADIVFAPRATTSETRSRCSVLKASHCAERIREIEFHMDTDRSVLSDHYAQLAETIAIELRAGLNVAYLTIGDTLTYSPMAMYWRLCKSCYQPCRSAPFLASQAMRRRPLQ